MPAIADLEPRIVWEVFDRITAIPRPSGKEGKIIRFLEEFAAANGLEHKKDRAGNVVITRPASHSMTGKTTVILQSHVDMVCEKNSGVEFDFDTDAIQTCITDDGWVKAQGTTLGADDGIGMAAALAVLTVDAELPAIEALFTVDEETGLTGTFNLGEGMLTGKYLINLDSEDEGEIFIGCAGGVDTVAAFALKTEPAPDNYVFFRVDIGGLRGGHSGDDIDKGGANSNKLLARLLCDIKREVQIRIGYIDGGNLRNAIPREASAVFGVAVKLSSRVFEALERFQKAVHDEFRMTDPDIEITVSETVPQKTVFDKTLQTSLLNAVNGLPNGVLAMSFDMPGLVETSSNTASVKITDDGRIVAATSQRSSVDSARYAAASSVRSVFELAGAVVKHSDGYPGWKPNPASDLLKVSVEAYRKLFKAEAKVRAIHAGLECGLFLEKYPELEMVSIGPTLRGAHSPDERLEISSVDKFWRLLLEILRNIG